MTHQQTLCPCAYPSPSNREDSFSIDDKDDWDVRGHRQQHVGYPRPHSLHEDVPYPWRARRMSLFQADPHPPLCAALSPLPSLRVCLLCLGHYPLHLRRPSHHLPGKLRPRPPCEPDAVRLPFSCLLLPSSLSHPVLRPCLYYRKNRYSSH